MGSTSILCILVTVFAAQVASAQYANNYYRRRYYYNRPASSVVVRRYVPNTVTESDTTSDGNFDQDSDKVRLDIYYASDCPDSMRFITRQLYPLYQEMDDILDIHLIPYGKASAHYNPSTKKYDFYCQHGSSECYGNAVQSCVMSLYPKKKEYLSFINCMESYPRPSRNGHKCARRLSLDWDKIDKCATGEEGNRIQKEMADLTESLNPRLYFVPWIIVNKVHTQTNQRTGLWDLKSVVCNAYKGSHPKCPEYK